MYAERAYHILKPWYIFCISKLWRFVTSSASNQSDHNMPLDIMLFIFKDFDYKYSWMRKLLFKVGQDGFLFLFFYNHIFFITIYRICKAFWKWILALVDLGLISLPVLDSKHNLAYFRHQLQLATNFNNLTLLWSENENLLKWSKFIFAK